MTELKVLITRRWPKRAEAEFSARFNVTLNAEDRPLSKSELRQALFDYDAVCPSVTDVLDAEVFSVAEPRCRIVGNFGVGYNHIDLTAAKKLGLTVTNTPGVLTESTADLAMTLLLMAARRAGEGERLVRAGHWQGWSPTQLLGGDVTGKTLGLIGFGRIAQALARKAHFGFGINIVFYNPSAPPAEETETLQASRLDTVEQVLEISDFVSLHCPGKPETRHLLNRNRLALMKPEAFLINTARGDVVDSKALIEALKNNRIAGAGLDVYENEPALHPGFLTLDNVTLLPHLGSATRETRTRMGLKVLTNLEMFFQGKIPPDQVI